MLTDFILKCNHNMCIFIVNPPQHHVFLQWVFYGTVVLHFQTQVLRQVPQVKVSPRAPFSVELKEASTETACFARHYVARLNVCYVGEAELAHHYVQCSIFIFWQVSYNRPKLFENIIWKHLIVLNLIRATWFNKKLMGWRPKKKSLKSKQY